MTLTLNPEYYKDIFALPVCIADECIKFASRDQFKVILWLFRHASDCPDATVEALAKALCMDKGEVTDALEYWIEKGIIIPGEDAGTKNNVLPGTVSAARSEMLSEKIIPMQKPPYEQSHPGNREALPVRMAEIIPVNPPTHEEVSKRCSESKYIREIFQTTEQRLGSSLSFGMQSTLVMMHDDYGLPVEVIALAVEHLASKHKANSSNLSKLGKIWCDREIDTIDKAMDYIEAENSVTAYWKSFCEMTGTKNPKPSKKQREYLEEWINKLGFNMEMIVLAYEEMAERTNKFSFQYMNSILVNWSNEGISTPAQAEKAKEERSKMFNKKNTVQAPEKTTASSDASYDLDAYTKKAFSNPMNLLRKEG